MISYGSGVSSSSSDNRFNAEVIYLNDKLNIVSEAVYTFSNSFISFYPTSTRVFPGLFRHGGTSAGEQSVNGGIHEGDIDLMGGPNFDRLYHKLKVLLLILLNSDFNCCCFNISIRQ